MSRVLSDVWICDQDERPVVTVLNLAATLATAFRLWVDVGRLPTTTLGRALDTISACYPPQVRAYITVHMLEPSCIADVVDSMADGCLVGDDELSVCLVLDYGHEFVPCVVYLW